MGIVVDHSPPGPELGPLAIALGTGQAATRAVDRNEERARFLMGLQQQRDQFDVNAALRVRDQDIQQRQWQTNLAMQDARQQQIAANNYLNRQTALEQTAMREQADLIAQQQNQAFEWQQKAALGVDEQVADRMKTVQQLNLNDVGKRLLNEKMGRLREVQSQKGFYRPEAYQQFLSQWLGDLDQANLDAYVVHEPTAQEKVYNNLVPLQGQQIVPGQPLPPGTYRSLKGTRNGVDSWETITIPPSETGTIAERFERDSVPAPDGGVLLWNPEKQDWKHIPPKSTTGAKEKPVDMGKYIKDALSMMQSEYQLDPTETKPAFKADPAEIKRRALELKRLEEELKAEIAGGTAATAEPTPAETTQAVEVSSPAEAASVPIGGTFIFNGQAYRVTGPGEAEPI